MACEVDSPGPRCQALWFPTLHRLVTCHVLVNASRNAVLSQNTVSHCFITGVAQITHVYHQDLFLTVNADDMSCSDIFANINPNDAAAEVDAFCADDLTMSISKGSSEILVSVSGLITAQRLR